MRNNQVLVVDDDPDFLLMMKAKLKRIGFGNVTTEDSPVRAAALFDKGNIFDLAFIDMTMPEMDGMQLLEHLKNAGPTTECIMITAVNDVRVAIECLRRGAYDYLVKPVSRDTLALSMERALERKRLLDILDIEKRDAFPKLVYADTFKPIVTRSRKMFNILKEAELHAQSDVPVLITGESGTGKELLAKALHCASPRSKYGFTPVNMASVSPGLFESEFFGHTRGSFTGAQQDRNGYLQQAEGGTLFLDEIGTLPMELQGKLLRVLQDGEYVKVGANQHQQADVRFIAATNENLEKLMAAKMFRKDLYYRIRGGWLHLPPLREKKKDIPLLIDRFLKDYCGPGNSCTIEENAMKALMAYDYPGNIRELKSMIQSAVNLCQGKPVSLRCLPKDVTKGTVDISGPSPQNQTMVTLAHIEKEHIMNVFQLTDKNKSKTARILGIGLNTLRRKLKVYAVR